MLKYTKVLSKFKTERSIRILFALCSTFSPVINSDSIRPFWMKRHTGQAESRPQHQPHVPVYAPRHPHWPPVAPQTCHEDRRTSRPIVNLGDVQGVRAGEKQGGKGERAVAVNEGQTVSFAPTCTRVGQQSMMGLMALQLRQLL